MSRPFVLPDLGEGLMEAEVLQVLVHEGDVVREDAPLLEVETDKARVEIPSPMSGRVERIHVHPGQSVHVGEVLVTFGAAAEAVTATAAARRVESADGDQRQPASNVAEARGAASASARVESVASATSADIADARAMLNIGREAPSRSSAVPPPADIGPVPATPSTRRLARELGVDLRTVRGTGPAGRVMDADVRAAADAVKQGAPATPAEPQEVRTRRVDEEVPPGMPRAEPPHEAKPLATVGLEPPPLPRFEQWGPIERQPLSHLRRTIAERMALSATLIPHVTHFDRADITELDAIVRKNEARARDQGFPLTLTSFILKACAAALRAHARFNASLDPAAGEMILKRYYHLGVAVATERGLIVPVIRDVDQKPLAALARELGALAQRVREGRATLDDLRGGTFTVTNIGALGGTGAIPIINYPEVAILGVARAREEAVVRGGQIVPRLMLPVTLTFDHRIADGADGARFASEIVRLLEHPDQLFLEL